MTTATTALDAIRKALARLDQASERHRRNGDGPAEAHTRSLAYLAWQEKDEAATDQCIEAEEELVRLIRLHSAELPPQTGGGFGPDQPIHAMWVDGRLLMLTAPPGTLNARDAVLDLYVLDERAIGGGA
jgi:hypothetical protein